MGKLADMVEGGGGGGGEGAPWMDGDGRGGTGEQSTT